MRWTAKTSIRRADGEGMRYILREKDSSIKGFATHVRLNGRADKLIWESSVGQDVLVVQTRYNSNALDKMDKVCSAMNGMRLPEERFAEVASLPETWVRYVSYSAYMRDDGCMLHDKACSYTVFCCEIQDDVCMVYTQDAGNAGNLPYCNIRLDILVQVHKFAQPKGIADIIKRFLGTREIEANYHQIMLPREQASSVGDGDLYYTVSCAKDLEIPITRQMFQNGTVYVKSYDEPQVASHNNGLHVLQRNG